MEITSLSSIKPGIYSYRIRVRICRTWRAIRYAAEQHSRLHCVMIDQQGGSVHGFMPEDQVEDMLEKPAQGRSVPMNCFRLIEFGNLDAEREAHAIPSSEAILTDVCGCIKSIQRPHPQFIKTQNKYGVKCEIVLENLGRESLTIVFWGKLAREFNIEAITSLPSPVIAIFTGLKMTQFNHRVVANNYDHTCLLLNPEIAWAQEYKDEFSKPGDKPMILGDPHIFQTTGPRKPVSIQALTGLDPANYKSASVLCRGQIIKIGSQGWWYRRCPERGCFRQCFKTEDSGGKYRCKTHGLQPAIPCFRVNMLPGDEVSDVNVTIMGSQAEQLFGLTLEALRTRRIYINEQIIPPEISAIIGQIYIIEVKGNTYGEWVAIGIEPMNAATASNTLAEETTLHTPEKICFAPKRTAEHVPRALFAETKKTRREVEEVSASSSASQEKDKVD